MIKQAIIIIVVFFSSALSAHEFSWDNLLLSDAKLNPNYDFEVFVDAYMARYRRPVWNKYKNDEFELEGKRQETIEIMKKRFEAFDLNQEFIINTTFEFGKYDFKQQFFTIDGIGANSFFRQSKNWYGESVFPNSYAVYFTNPEIVGNLPMEKDIAKAFIQNKKTSYGKVDRKLPTRIKFKITQKRGEKEFDAQITEITVFDKKESSILAVFK